MIGIDYYQPMLPLHRCTLIFTLIFALNANAQPPAGEPAAPVSSLLNGALFYQLLLGELNARSGESGAAFSLMLDAARRTHDAALYQRTVNLALEAHSGDSALLAARAWKQAFPVSRDANRYVLQILIGLNQLGETLEPLKRELALAGEHERGAAIELVPRFFERANDKALAASIVERVLADDLARSATGASAWSVVGRMRLYAGDMQGALVATDKAQNIDVRSEQAALLAVFMLESKKMPEAEVLVKKYLQGQAQAQPEVRMAYIRALLDMQRYLHALAQLKIVTTENPGHPQAWLMRGVIELQDGQSAAAEHTLKHYLELALPKDKEAPNASLGRGLTQAYLALAEIAESKNNLAEADSWLGRIDDVDDRLNAQLRRAHILARRGQLEQAIQLIRSQTEKSPADTRLKISAEVQLLRDARQYRRAHSVLASVVSVDPTDFDFVYDLAMVAEKLGQLDEMERLLRSVIAAEPGVAHAYNALGYSLAERNLRLDEARALILKALELAPSDPAITDSLGWVEFRIGNLAQAQRHLEAAFKMRPDAEVAAHLGEVMWANGHRDEAAVIWKQGILMDANNEVLLETLKRLRVAL